MELLKFFLVSIYKPFKTLKTLSYSTKSKQYGWFFTLAFAFLYSLTSLILSIKGFTPLAEPSLPISAVDYYYFQTFFTLPVGVLGVGLNYFIIVGALKMFSINISKQNLWGPVSLSSVLSSFFTFCFPETFIVSLFYSANEWNYLTFDLIRIAAGTLWTVVLTVLAIKTIETVKWWQSILIGVISSGVMGTLMGLCYR